MSKRTITLVGGSQKCKTFLTSHSVHVCRHSLAVSDGRVPGYSPVGYKMVAADLFYSFIYRSHPRRETKPAPVTTSRAVPGKKLKVSRLQCSRRLIPQNETLFSSVPQTISSYSLKHTHIHTRLACLLLHSSSHPPLPASSSSSSPPLHTQSHTHTHIQRKHVLTGPRRSCANRHLRRQPTISDISVNFCLRQLKENKLLVVCNARVCFFYYYFGASKLDVRSG